MRSRIAITALLAMGALMSSGGAALGVSALSSDTNASSAQYGPRGNESVRGPSGRSLGSSEAGDRAGEGRAFDEDGVGGAGGGRGAGEGGPGGGVSGVQAARQLGGEGQGELPFTGYASIPLLLLGLAMLVAGLTLRRGTRRASAPR